MSSRDPTQERHTPPPKWTLDLLRRIVPSERREDVLGDFEESHAERRKRLGASRSSVSSSFDAVLVAFAFVIYRSRAARWSLVDWATGSEVRLAVRLMRKQPLFALTAVSALAVGIGLASTGFTVLEATTFAELPFERGNRFVRIAAHTEPDGQDFPIDKETFRLLREKTESFLHVGAISGEQVTVGEASDLEPLRANLITPDSFLFVEAQPIVGRVLLGSDALLSSEPVVVLRESLWQRRFNRSRGVVGEILEVDGVAHTVVGVMPDDFEFPASGEIWLPLRQGSMSHDPAEVPFGPAGREVATGRPFAILEDDASIEDASAELNHISASLETGSADTSVKIDVSAYTATPEGWGLGMSVLVTVLILVLIVIACNVANLIFARTEARTGELAIRSALGAPRRRLIGQLFVEVAAMGVVATFIGLAVSRAVLLRMDASFDELPFWIDLSPGPRTGLFALALTFLAAAIGGVVPALKATRRSPAVALGSCSTTGSGRFGFGRFGNLAIVSQMALSVALLAGALVFARGFLLHTQPSESLPRGTVLTAQLTGFSTASPKLVLERAIGEVAAVESYGIGSHLPRVDPPLRRFSLDSQVGDPSGTAESLLAPVAWVSRGFLETLGAKPLSGRLFRDEDWQEGAPQVAVVNELFVERFLAGRNPIGHRIEMQVRDQDTGTSMTNGSYEVVGVVPDLGLSETDPDSAAGFYLPLDERPLYYVALSTRGDPMALEAPLRASLAAIDPKVQLRRATPLENVGSEDRAMLTSMGSAMSATGMVALLLSMIGIYSMMSFAVTRRTREIGIRSALGASRAQILLSILGGASIHLAVGGVLGALLGSLLLRGGRTMFVTRLPTAEPWVLPLVLVGLVVTGILACYTPARRALGIRPSEALRSE